MILYNAHHGPSDRSSLGSSSTETPLHPRHRTVLIYFRALTTAVTTGLWFSMRASWLSLAHSNRVYIMAVPRLASTCSSTFDRISCFVSAELLLNHHKGDKQLDHHTRYVNSNNSVTLWSWTQVIYVFIYPMCRV